MWFYFIKQVTSGPPAKLKIIDIDLSEVRYVLVFCNVGKVDKSRSNVVSLFSFSCWSHLALRLRSSYQQRAWTNSECFSTLWKKKKRLSHDCPVIRFLANYFVFAYLQPLSVYNDTRMPIPLKVQLCDKLGNPSYEANVKVVLNCDRGIKVRAFNLK